MRSQAPQLRLPAEDSSVPRARGFTTATLAQWGIPAGDAEQVVAELASNAVRAAQATDCPLILIRLVRGPVTVVVEVGDTSSLAPVITPPRARREHGRGLPLVINLADDTGWYAAGAWKIVWAQLPAQPARAAAPGKRGRAA